MKKLSIVSSVLLFTLVTATAFAQGGPSNNSNRSPRAAVDTCMYGNMTGVYKNSRGDVFGIDQSDKEVSINDVNLGILYEGEMSQTGARDTWGAATAPAEAFSWYPAPAKFYKKSRIGSVPFIKKVLYRVNRLYPGYEGELAVGVIVQLEIPFIGEKLKLNVKAEGTVQELWKCQRIRYQLVGFRVENGSTSELSRLAEAFIAGANMVLKVVDTSFATGMLTRIE